MAADVVVTLTEAVLVPGSTVQGFVTLNTDNAITLKKPVMANVQEADNRVMFVEVQCED